MADGGAETMAAVALVKMSPFDDSHRLLLSALRDLEAACHPSPRQHSFVVYSGEGSEVVRRVTSVTMNTEDGT